MTRIGVIDLLPLPRQQWLDQLTREEDAPLTGVRLHLLEGKADGLAVAKTLEPRFWGELHQDAADSYVVSLPTELLHFRILTFPFSDPQKIRRALPLELERYSWQSDREIVCEGIPLGEAEGGQDILAVYGEKDALQALATRLETADIRPAAITSLTVGHILKGDRRELAGRLACIGELNPAARSEAVLREARKPSLNLKTIPLRTAKEARLTLRRVRVALALGFCLLAVLFTDVTYRMLICQADSERLRTDIAAQYRSLFPGERKVADATYQLRAHVKDLQDRQHIYAGVQPLQDLSRLAKIRSLGAIFNEINLDRGGAQLKAETAALSDLEKIKTELNRTWPQTQVVDVKNTAEGKITFSVVAAGRP